MRADSDLLADDLVSDIVESSMQTAAFVSRRAPELTLVDLKPSSGKDITALFQSCQTTLRPLCGITCVFIHISRVQQQQQQQQPILQAKAERITGSNSDKGIQERHSLSGSPAESMSIRILPTEDCYDLASIH